MTWDGKMGFSFLFLLNIDGSSQKTKACQLNPFQKDDVRVRERDGERERKQLSGNRTNK